MSAARMVASRDPSMSIWQSSVEEIARERAADPADPLERADAYGPLSAVQSHAASPGDGPDAAEDAAVLTSRQMRALADTLPVDARPGVESVLEALPEAVRRYADSDLAGWVECIERYLLYKARYLGRGVV